MLIRDITYENLDKQTVTRAFYFNLTAAEVLELETSFGAIGLVEAINRIQEAKDVDTMMKEFKRIILMTYGVRDGDDFLKSEELTRRFVGCGAYSALLMEFLTVEGALVKFIEGVAPSKVPGMEEAKPEMPPPPTNFEVSKITPQQMAMGQAIIEGNANG